MNRSITNVLLGLFGSAAHATVSGDGHQGTMREVNLDDVAVQLAYAKQVVFGGYGMATAQAQHA